jgi:tetratricopeptide (TPR) repeat protein
MLFGFTQAEDVEAPADLHVAGVLAFRAGQYTQAIELWSQAYAQVPLENEQQRSSLSKDIAIAYRRLGDTANAIGYYERCLSDWPGQSSERAANIRAWIADVGYTSTRRRALGITLAITAAVAPLFAAIAFTSMRHRAA